MTYHESSDFYGDPNFEQYALMGQKQLVQVTSDEVNRLLGACEPELIVPGTVATDVISRAADGGLFVSGFVSRTEVMEGVCAYAFNTVPRHYRHDYQPKMSFSWLDGAEVFAAAVVGDTYLETPTIAFNAVRTLLPYIIRAKPFDARRQRISRREDGTETIVDGKSDRAI